jgi:hypothetical protein
LGEGPCLDAYQQDRVVAEPDLADPVTRRWFAFTPSAVKAGVRAVFGLHFAVHNAAGMVSVQVGISVAEALIPCGRSPRTSSHS